MPFDMNKYLAAGTKVRIKEPCDVPEWSKWDDDGGRTSSQVKKRMQAMFFRGDRKIVGEVLYIGRESEREMLRRKGQIKIRVRDSAGTMLAITADPSNLIKVA